MAALERANEVRTMNASRRREVEALPMMEGRRRVAELLLEADEYTSAVPVERLLGWIHRIGVARVVVVLRVVGITPGRRVGDLTGRQREVLAAILVSGRPLSAFSGRRLVEFATWGVRGLAA